MLEIVGLIAELIGIIASTIANSIAFIVGIFTTLPPLFFGLFGKLPLVYQYGLESLIGIVIMILVFKVITLLKSSG